MPGHTLSESVAMLDAGDIRKFASSVNGQVILPSDAGYDSSRAVFNAMIDKRPAIICRCADTSDVIACVNFARDHNVVISARGGGHNVAGRAVNDGGLVVDFSAMKGMAVDPVNRIARAQSGLRLGEFDRQTQAVGLATPLGTVSNTGIAGLTLGGGMGWLMSKHGLACDNLLSMEVVTADGRVVVASADQNQDLFWALRGGGGNFGIVTSFEYRLHPVGTVLGGLIQYPARQAAEVLRFYAGFAHECPDEMSTFAAFMNNPDGEAVLAITVCYCGKLEAGEVAVKPLRNFGSPVSDTIARINFVDMQALFDSGFPEGRIHYWSSNFIRVLSDRAIDTIVEYAARGPSPTTVIALQQMHGVASRVAPTATAFRHRYELHNFMILSNWSEPADSEKNVTWTREFSDAMQPLLERDLYVNDLGDVGEDRVRAAYGGNYDRLVALKNKYDPANFFRMNQNIKPTG